MSDVDDNMEFIEAYFKNQLIAAEKIRFEERCTDDELFARQVAIYITAEEGIRQKLLQEKKQQWRGNDANSEGAAVIPMKKAVLRKWLPYAAAACLVFAVTLFFLLRPETPQQLAAKYIREHFILLSQTMNASKDSLQQGFAAYNDKDFNKALQIFKEIYRTHPGNSIAKKHIGLVYLVTKDYDKALKEFDELTQMKDAYRNPGYFLKALTILQIKKKVDK